MSASDGRRPAETLSLGGLNVQAHPADSGDRRHALVVVQGAISGSALAAYIESYNPSASVLDINRIRKSDGTEGEDTFRVLYEGKRGLYANGYGCARARTPAHADAADQVAFRAACHSTKDGSAQVVLDVTQSDNTTKLMEVRANGEVRFSLARYLACTLGTSIVSRTAVTVATFRSGGSFEFRGTLQWPSGVTIGGGATLLTVDTEHFP